MWAMMPIFLVVDGGGWNIKDVVVEENDLEHSPRLVGKLAALMELHTNIP